MNKKTNMSTVLQPEIENCNSWARSLPSSCSIASVSSSDDPQPSSFELLLLEEATPFKAVKIASAWTVSSRHLSKGRVGDSDPRRQAVSQIIMCTLGSTKMVRYSVMQVSRWQDVYHHHLS